MTETLKSVNLYMAEFMRDAALALSADDRPGYTPPPAKISEERPDGS